MFLSVEKSSRMMFFFPFDFFSLLLIIKMHVPESLVNKMDKWALKQGRIVNFLKGTG